VTTGKPVFGEISEISVEKKNPACERNKINHQERCLTPAEFQFLILRHCDEWKEHIAKKPKQATSKVQHWTPPPPPDVIKINLDGAFLKDARRGGWGAIGRDHSGEPVFAAFGCIPVVADALQSELLALIHAIPVAEQLGINWKCHSLY
jgi:hypothetical protein